MSKCSQNETCFGNWDEIPGGGRCYWHEVMGHHGWKAMRNIVEYMAIDFNIEKMGEKIFQGRYDKSLKTFFIWEGTTPYITREAFDETLDFVKSNSAKGSSIIFDYILRSVVEGNCNLDGAMNEYARMSKTSEPFIFGIEESEIGQVLAKRGFSLISDAGPEYFSSKYFCDKKTIPKIKPWWRIAHAEVRD